MNLFKTASLLVIVIALNSCYPNDSIPVSDLDIVVTHRNEEINNIPGKYNTYAITDVLYDPEESNGRYNGDLVKRIRKNMNSLGYTELANPSDTNLPDLIMIPEIIMIDNYVVGGGGCYYGCWGWACPGCWYGGYPPYYPPTYAVSYTTGTILIHMVDPKLVDQKLETRSVVWNGAVNGLARNGVTNDQLDGYVDQAFNQSKKYLKK